ncbi:MAG: ATP-binding protein [Rhodobacteraceae bacterium]|nr:ATP-binding protein [Paracoccaceae bacterium]MCY4138755.1 ATP-binding protein [Paracoccaceae bacterium]
MSKPVFYPRSVEHRLVEALEDSPVVLIHGPRQCGKTTLAQVTCAPNYLAWSGDRSVWGHSREDRGYRYFSFDDPVTRNGARADPMGFVADLPERVILDEVQRVPELFDAIKLSVDRRRAPGRFLLTGSTNVFLVPKLSESLAGRIQIVPLHPLTQFELTGHSNPSRPDAGFLNALFGDGFPIFQCERLGGQLVEKIVAGGYPAALARPTPRRQANWYRDYVEALVQRDARDITRVRSLDVLPRLLRAAAAHTAQLFNLSGLASPFELSRPSIGDYVTLLERLFLLERLPAWHSNRLKRLVKSPKLHLTDTGLAAALLGTDTKAFTADRTLLGSLVETFVYQELRRQASWRDTPTEFFHFRDKDGVETDIVIEQTSGAVAGVEIKVAATVTSTDFRGLRKLEKAVGSRFVRGIVLYDGETSIPFGNRFHAVPMSRMWCMP